MPFARALPSVFHVPLKAQVWEAPLCRLLLPLLCALTTSFTAGPFCVYLRPTAFSPSLNIEFLEDKNCILHTSVSPVIIG